MSLSKPIDTFRYKELTVLPLEPKYEHIALLQQQLNANARAISSTRGDGKHGLLWLVVGDKKYKEITGETFIAPTKPPIHPLIEPHATSAEVALAKIRHEARTTEWNRSIY